jgi:hypothetical protein
MNTTKWTTMVRRRWGTWLSGVWKWLRIVFGFIVSGDGQSGPICNQFGPRTKQCQSCTIGVRGRTDVQYDRTSHVVCITAGSLQI